MGGGRGQILWVRGLTRLQQQVGPVCPLTLSPHPQPPTSLPVHLGCVPCCVRLQSDLYCVSVFVAFGFGCHLTVCVSGQKGPLFVCVYVHVYVCVCVLEMCLFWVGEGVCLGLVTAGTILSVCWCTCWGVARLRGPDLVCSFCLS